MSSNLFTPPPDFHLVGVKNVFFVAKSKKFLTPGTLASNYLTVCKLRERGGNQLLFPRIEGDVIYYDQPMNDAKFYREIRSRLTELGFSKDIVQQFTQHSFRPGSVTDAMGAGVAPTFIMTQGRWKTLAWMIYNRITTQALDHQSRQLIQACFRTEEDTSWNLAR